MIKNLQTEIDRYQGLISVSNKIKVIYRCSESENCCVDCGIKSNFM